MKEILDNVELKKNKLYESEFKKRYNRDVEVFNFVDREETGFVKRSFVKLNHRKHDYLLLEHFNSKQATDYVLFYYKDKIWKFKTYLEAEVSLADKIGELYGA